MRMIILVACLWLATSPLWGKIAFHSRQTGTYQIYTMNSDGSNQTQITFSEDRAAYPIWSPDGRQIVFSRRIGGAMDGNTEVFVMDADGSNQRNLSNHPGYDSLPDWSPDGRQIVFNSNRNRNPDKNIFTNLFVMDADGGNVRQITQLSWTTHPKWSPDGTQIAFETDDFEIDRQVYVVDADGRNLWRASSPKANTAMVLKDWSPDGKQILYTEAIESRNDKATLILATLDPVRQGEIIRFERVPVPKMPMRTQSFSPDGKSILLSGKPDNSWEDKNWEIYRFVLADRQLIRLTDNWWKEAGPHESDAPFSVPSQPGRLPVSWGEIKSVRSQR